MSFQAGASPTPVAPGFGGTRLATGPKQDANRRWSSSLRLWPRNSSTVCSCQASLIWRSVSASSGRQRSTPPISAPITACSLVTESVLIRSAAIATPAHRRLVVSPYQPRENCMASISLSQAVRFSELGKFTFARALKSTWLSASRTEAGSYEIDPGQPELAAGRFQALIPWRVVRPGRAEAYTELRERV